MKSGNLIKIFNDLQIALKNYPECKFEISDEEQTFKKELKL